jgi:hypothetical protein
MYQEKRPTCVTVIGWAWIILGGLMFLSSIIGLFASISINQSLQADPEATKEIPAMFKYFSFIAVGQMGMALLGFIAGINFLKLKMWARNVLEVLTWLLLLFILGFMVYWEFNWIAMTSEHAPHGFDIMGAAMGIVITGIYGIPLGIMVKYLRGNKVNNAIMMAAEAASSEGQPGPTDF